MVGTIKNSMFLILIVGFFGFRYLANRPTSHAPAVILKSIGENQQDPCHFKKRCLIVYVAPWCSSCSQARPLINAIRNRSLSSSFGVKVIVGLDQANVLDFYAQNLGPDTYVDYEKEFYTKINGSSIPAWYLTNETNRILGYFNGTISSPDIDMSVNHVLTEKLGMDVKYFRAMAH